MIEGEVDKGELKVVVVGKGLEVVGVKGEDGLIGELDGLGEL